MNVYDFDKTIYNGDSTLDYYTYSIKKQPTLFLYFPKQLLSLMLYKLGKKEKLAFKQDFYGFLKYQKNQEQIIQSFWDEHEHKMMTWYKEKQQEDDLIISASPEFLLTEICKRQGIQHLIASKVNQRSGICESANCYGEEKVVRYKEIYDGQPIEKFYSDSKSDEPMAKLATQSYMVSKEKVINWPW